MSQYRYHGDHATEVVVNGTGAMVGFGEFVELSTKDQEDVNNLDLITTGVLLPITTKKEVKADD
jgi:hypothetical protein